MDERVEVSSVSLNPVPVGIVRDDRRKRGLYDPSFSPQESKNGQEDGISTWRSNSPVTLALGTT